MLTSIKFDNLDYSYKKMTKKIVFKKKKYFRFKTKDFLNYLD